MSFFMDVTFCHTSEVMNLSGGSVELMYGDIISIVTEKSGTKFCRIYLACSYKFTGWMAALWADKREVGSYFYLLKRYY